MAVTNKSIENNVIRLKSYTKFSTKVNTLKIRFFKYINNLIYYFNLSRNANT